MSLIGSESVRGKKAVINIFGSLTVQLITVICGFIVPRLTIGAYGSEMNGIINSASQFLGYIALLDAGVGGVVRSALYKPLADNDYRLVSGIVNATERFFRQICLVFVFYSVVVACVFPVMVDDNHDWFFDFALVLIIAFSTIGQYYFGITYQVMLQADQKRYVSNFAQSISLVLNAIVVVVCIKLGASVHVMKLASSIVFFLRPVAINIYVKKKYPLDGKIPPDKDSIKQRWDGLAHHIAFFLHSNTDIVVLTVFSKITSAFAISEVSVYSVYYSVVYGVEKISAMLHQAVEAAFGNMIAKEEDEVFKNDFRIYELLSFMLTTAVFTCAGVLVVPFVKVYTSGITDANYIRPAFAYALTLAEAVYCLRMPYNNVTLAAGHYRQTRNGAFVEAIINVVLSVVLVIPFGITGVAVATLTAMIFRTGQYVYYLYKNILRQSVGPFFKSLAVNAAASAAVIASVRAFEGFFSVDSYISLLVYAVVVAVVCFAAVFLMNLIFNKKDLTSLVKMMRKVLRNFIKK